MLKAQNTGAPVRLVLSTGRTGSTLLREYLKALDTALDIAFEPYPSRRSYMLWNASQLKLLPKSLVHRDFLRVMGKAWARRNKHAVRIEMHAYLAPMICELAGHYAPVEFVHLVRHPFTWIPSLANFRAAGWRAQLIDIVPFTRHRHPQADRPWRELSELERGAWRWRFTNEKLLALGDRAQRYALVRYEDLTSTDSATAEAALARVRELLLDGLDAPPRSLDLGERHNASHRSAVPAWHSWSDADRGQVAAICQPLLGALGYEALPP